MIKSPLTKPFWNSNKQNLNSSWVWGLWNSDLSNGISCSFLVKNIEKTSNDSEECGLYPALFSFFPWIIVNNRWGYGEWKSEVLHEKQILFDNHGLNIKCFVIGQRLSHLGIIRDNYYQSGHVANTIILLLSLPSHYNRLLTILMIQIYSLQQLVSCSFIVRVFRMMQYIELLSTSQMQTEHLLSGSALSITWMNSKEIHSSCIISGMIYFPYLNLCV